MSFITRFAPSPTGRLHLGHAYSAFLVHDAARAANGRLHLRIEDADRARCRPEYEAALLDDLHWLGIEWETPLLRQSEEMAAYQSALQHLIDMGAVYRCFRTRRDILLSLAHAPHEHPGSFLGAPLPPAEEEARLARGEAFAWRLATARLGELLGARIHDLAFTEIRNDQPIAVPVDPARLRDAILARKDFPASYHLASVWDDARQGVTHIIRSEDLRDSAHLHVTLQALLGLKTPIYQHHPLLADEAGKRLSKRDGAQSIAALRDTGMTPADIRRLAWSAPRLPPP